MRSATFTSRLRPLDDRRRRRGAQEDSSGALERCSLHRTDGQSGIINPTFELTMGIRAFTAPPTCWTQHRGRRHRERLRHRQPRRHLPCRHPDAGDGWRRRLQAAGIVFENDGIFIDSYYVESRHQRPGTARGPASVHEPGIPLTWRMMNVYQLTVNISGTTSPSPLPTPWRPARKRQP